MSLLRILLRAFFPRRRSRHHFRPARASNPSLPRKEQVPSTSPPPIVPPRPQIVVRQNLEITIVAVFEVLGPAWVIDGDTIDIGGTRIRLAGIDAPEMDHPYGKSAKWTLVNLCKGRQVRAVFDGKLSHDRTVATCYLPDGRDLSAEMVRAGMAIDWPKFSRGKYASLELPGIRKKLWRCDARQKGLMPPSLPD